MGHKPGRKIGKSKAAKKAEAACLEKLCKDHGYVMIEARKGDRVRMMMNTNGKSREITPRRCILFAVPYDSALGEQLAKLYETKKPPTIADGKKGAKQ